MCTSQRAPCVFLRISRSSDKIWSRFPCCRIVTHLTATAVPVPTCRALYTTPLAPAPSSPIISRSRRLPIGSDIVPKPSSVGRFRPGDVTSPPRNLRPVVARSWKSSTVNAPDCESENALFSARRSSSIAPSSSSEKLCSFR